MTGGVLLQSAELVRIRKDTRLSQSSPLLHVAELSSTWSLLRWTFNGPRCHNSGTSRKVPMFLLSIYAEDGVFSRSDGVCVRASARTHHLNNTETEV